MRTLGWGGKQRSTTKRENPDNPCAYEDGQFGRGLRRRKTTTPASRPYKAYKEQRDEVEGEFGRYLEASIWPCCSVETNEPAGQDWKKETIG